MISLQIINVLIAWNWSLISIHLRNKSVIIKSHDSLVGIATDCGQERPDRHWRPPSFLSNGYRGAFPQS